jgi:hypothetical protein
MNNLLIDSLNAIVSAYNADLKERAYKILELTCQGFKLEGKIETLKELQNIENKTPEK